MCDRGCVAFLTLSPPGGLALWGHRGAPHCPLRHWPPFWERGLGGLWLRGWPWTCCPYKRSLSDEAPAPGASCPLQMPLNYRDRASCPSSSEAAVVCTIDVFAQGALAVPWQYSSGAAHVQNSGPIPHCVRVTVGDVCTPSHGCQGTKTTGGTQGITGHRQSTCCLFCVGWIFHNDLEVF